LDPFTYQKALQKIIESNQVDKKTKARIKKMKKSER
ncbi:DNA alkylation repair protein, partial [Turicibacter sanguinis]|nr:DNA alkylation repair protein [Turicibacter sanguinis]MTL49432.1 DNA alkylation repair protein [Turicibacter sanguinis]